MKFIIWTVVYWSILLVSKWLTVKSLGGYDKYIAHYGQGVVGVAELMNYVLWIVLYFLIVKKEI